jgi:hypothetical protein
LLARELSNIYLDAQILTLNRPIQGYWTPALGMCLDEGKTTLANGVVNTVADFITTVLPIPMIWGLKMPMNQKFGVMILLSLGFVVTVAGAVRSVNIFTIDEKQQTNVSQNILHLVLTFRELGYYMVGLSTLDCRRG